MCCGDKVAKSKGVLQPSSEPAVVLSGGKTANSCATSGAARTVSANQAPVLVNGTTADVSSCLLCSWFGIGVSSGGRSDMGTGAIKTKEGSNPEAGCDRIGRRH